MTGKRFSLYCVAGHGGRAVPKSEEEGEEEGEEEQEEEESRK